MSTIRIELDDDRIEQLQALRDRTGLATDALIGEAIDMLATALDQADEPPEHTPEQAAAIRAGLSAIERGETNSHEDVFAALRRKYGA